jgi:hypothetical protein
LDQAGFVEDSKLQHVEGNARGPQEIEIPGAAIFGDVLDFIASGYGHPEATLKLPSGHLVANR